MAIVNAALRGEVMLIMCDRLHDEVVETLARDKFRRWLTQDEADDFVDAVTMIAEWTADRPDNEIPQVCADPDDNYLIALCQDSDAACIVSGDRRVQEVKYPNVRVCAPPHALELLAFRHEWGDGYLPGDIESSMLQMQAEGSTALINAYVAFSSVFELIDEPEQARVFLNLVAVPSAVDPFIAGYAKAREMMNERGVGTRPVYASPDVAYLKLPPNPQIHIVSVGTTPLPPGTIYCTLQRCPDLPQPPELDCDYWRVFGIGQPWQPDDIPPRPHR